MAQAGLHVEVLALNGVGLRSAFSLGSLRRRGESVSGRLKEQVEAQLVIPGSEKGKALRWSRRMAGLVSDHIRQSGQPDLIHVHSSMWAGLAASYIRRTHGIPYLITEHRGRFISGNLEAEKMLSPWHIPLLKAAFDGAERVVTVSHALQGKILEISPDCTGRMETIPNMVDTTFFVPGQPRGTEPFVFLCLASLDHLKGLDTLLLALGKLKRKNTGSVRLIIGGEGPMKEELKGLTRKLSLEADVRFTGQLDREAVRQHLQSVHAFVLPSRYEAFGVVLIEAMACGLPVIASQAGGAPEIVRDDNGMLVPPDDPESLASAMDSLVRNPERYHAEAIRSYAERNFGRYVVAGAYLKIYQKIINTRKEQ